uniref:NS1 protein n=1 Tax=Rousettus bat parvovirus TaxID=3141931 RepID=A0AAU7E1P5_9VIRU
MNAQTWQAGVFSITFANGGSPVNDPKPYAACLSHIKSVKAWIMAGEHNLEGIFHVHAMALTLQRSDSFRRSIEREWFLNRFKFMDDVEEPDPILDVLKMQKCHKPESLLAYMCKDPLWICTSDSHYTNIMSSVYSYDMGERFRLKQQEKLLREQVTEGGNVNKIVADVLNVIYDHGCKTIEDCMKYAPDIMSQYLHRAGFSSIVQNCLTFVSATAHGWSLNRIATKHTSDPFAIHRCLLYQGIDIDVFDVSFYKWVTKQLPKHNTFVLWGPSNTGKSAFISGFKQCVQWGEIVNTNNFAFEGLIGNTFGIWEEPLISPELAEKAKQIFEGMECSIPVKFKKPVKLQRIPILMTTNHAPWRFCTHEESMFKNRMFIFNWLHDTTTSTMIYRNSSSCCSCDCCKRSRGSSPDPDSESASRMQREQQSVQLDGATNEGSNVWTGSMSRTGKGSIQCQKGSGRGGTKNSRSDNLRHSTDPTRSEKQCSNSSGSSISSSSTTSDRIRTSGTDRPSNSNIGISGTEPRDVISLVPNINRQHNGDDIRRDRMGGNGARDPGEGPSNSGGVISEHGTDGKMVELGKRSQTPENQIPTKKQQLDRKLDTLRIPCRNDWLCYMSYLQNTYG